MARVTPIRQIVSCSCGRVVAKVPGLDPMVCPHVPQPAFAISSIEASSPLAASVRALEQALDWLTRPCTDCTCPRVLIGDLDPDPDCPGLAAGADGCRSDGRIRAWHALEEVGLRYWSQSLSTEQLAVGRALQHAHDVLAQGLAARAAALAAAAAYPARVEVLLAPAQEVDVIAMRHAGASFPQIAAAVGWASAGTAHTFYEGWQRKGGKTTVRRRTSPAGAGRCTA